MKLHYLRRCNLVWQIDKRYILQIIDYRKHITGRTSKDTIIQPFKSDTR